MLNTLLNQCIGMSTPEKTNEQKDNQIQLSLSNSAHDLIRLLLQYHDPTVCSLLDSKKVTPNLYVQDWFSALYERSSSLELGDLIWDFKMSDPFFIFFAAIVMIVNASDSLKRDDIDQAGMLKILKTMPTRLEEDDIEDLFYLVSEHYTNTTPRSIRSYKHLLFLDQTNQDEDTTDCVDISTIDKEKEPFKLDPKTSILISELDLSQYLCLPILPAEIFAIETCKQVSDEKQPASSTNNSTSPQKSPSSPSSDGSTAETATPASPGTGSNNSQKLRYFLVDCRPAEQYNAGHLKKAFHLDCSLMLREPHSFETAVGVLLDIQRQVVNTKSNTGGQHICFIGSGQEEDDQYVNMVIASFLQKHQTKYVSIVVGGFEAIHNHVSNDSDLKSSFNELIADHDQELCKVCYSSTPDRLARYNLRRRLEAASLSGVSNSGSSIASSLFASTASYLRGDKTALSKFAAQTKPQTSQLAQSGALIFDRFARGFVSKSSEIKDRLVETLAAGGSLGAGGQPLIGSSSVYGNGAERSHVSHEDRLGRRYTGAMSSRASSFDSTTNEEFSNGTTASASIGTTTPMSTGFDGEPIQEVQLDSWLEEAAIFASYKCAQIKGSAKHPGYIAISKTHLWVLREIANNRGFFSIAAKRALDSIVKITSKRKQPDMIIFHYGDASQLSTTLHIPQPYEVIKLIKREIVRIVDEKKLREQEEAKVKDEETKPNEGDEAAAENEDETNLPAQITNDPAHSQTTTCQQADENLPEAADENAPAIKPAKESKEPEASSTETSKLDDPDPV